MPDHGVVTLNGWAETALGVPLFAGAVATWRFRVDRVNVSEVFQRPLAERSRLVSGLAAGLLLVAALVALVGGLATA